MSTQAQPRVYSAGDEVVPGYVLIERLGKGMSGDVWIAQGPGRTRVALKIVRTLSKLGGRKELAALQTIRNINHTNLCPLHGFWLKDRQGNLIAEAAEDSWIKDETTRVGMGTSPSDPAPGTVPVPGIAKTRPKLDVQGDQTSEETDQPVLNETTSVTGQLGFGFESTGKPSSESTVLPGSFPKAASTSSFETRVPRTAPASELWKQAEELIVVMGLGDCTLFDELQKVRRAAGIAPKDRTKVLGLPPEEIVRYVRESASAIDLLNIKHRIFHRDIKPQNILLVSGGAQVCDFGLAHKMDADSTATQQVMATPVYAPPELLDNRMVDKSVDQYCLAVTAFELRTGTLPFDATSMSKIVLAKCENRFSLDAVPVPERAVYLRALHVDPSKRFSTCREMVDALALAMGVDHVEKSSTKSIVWTAALIVALVVTPLSIYVYNLTTSSGSSADLVAFASQKYEAMPREEETMVARDTLRPVLETLLRASESGGDADESAQSLAKSVTTDFSDRLDDLSNRFDQFDGSGFKLIGQDEELLSRTIEGDPPALFPSDLPHAESLRSGILLRRALMQMAGELKSPSGAGATAMTPELRTRLKDHAESFNPWQTRNAALLIALSHRPLTDSEYGLCSGEPLEDLVRAHKAAEVGPSTIDDTPLWLQQPWSELLNAGKKQLDSAIQNGKLDKAAGDKILDTWPDLIIEAKLIAYERALSERRWVDADREGQVLQSLLTDNDDLKNETESRLQLFLRLHQSLLEPQKLSETMPWITKEIDNLPPLASQTKLALGNWWTETSHRWFMGQTPPTSESIASTVKESIGFSKLLHRSVPADIQSAQLCDWIATSEVPLDKELLATWIRQTVDDDENPDAMNRLMWLRGAISMDHSVESSMHDDGGAKTLPDVVAVEAIANRLPFGYADFVLGVANLKEGNSSAAMTAWSRLKGEEARQALGVRRAVILAEGWLGLAKGHSKIVDSEPIRLRYSDVSPEDIPKVADAISSAQWWAQGVGNRVDKNFRMSVWLQNWLVRAAHRSGDPPTRLPQFDRQAFSTLVLKEEEFRPADGQLVACAFALAKWVWEKPEALDPTDKTWWLDLLVTSADAAIQLHETRGEQVTDSIMESHVVPVAELVLSEPSHQPANPNSRANNILARFNEGLKDPGITDREKVEDYRRQKIEVLTEIALRSDKNEADDRWLELGEQTRQFVDADGAVWTTEKLDELRRYLDRAKDAKAETGKRYLLLDAFELAHRAIAEPDRDRRISLCQQSAERYAKLIQELRQSKTNTDAAKLYEALWRRADLLVNLAFFDDSLNKCASLREAYQNADEAVKMFDEVQWNNPPELNMPLGARGNSLEDLAFYRCEIDPKRQHETYLQAESSFDAAIQLTELAYDRGIRNRFGLARCITRHIEQCGGLVSDRDNKLEHAMRQLGDPPSDSQIPATHRMEWHIWASRVRFLQNNFEDAIAQARAAVEIGENEKLSDHHRNLAYYTLANLLSRKEAGSGLENNPLAMEMLDKIESPDDSMFWRSSEIRLDIIAERLKTYEDLPKFLKESELIQHIADGMKRAPNETMKVVGLAGRYLKLAADTMPGGAPPKVTSEYAKLKLDEMQKELAAFPVAKPTVAFLKCYRDVVANAPPEEQVRDWALALRSGDVDTRTLAETQELMVIQSMSWLRSQQFDDAFAPVAAPDRKLVADSVNQWALRRPAEEQAPLKLRKLISSIEAGKF